MSGGKMKKPMGGPGGRGPMSVNLDKAKDSSDSCFNFYYCLCNIKY